MKDSG